MYTAKRGIFFCWKLGVDLYLEPRQGIEEPEIWYENVIDMSALKPLLIGLRFFLLFTRYLTTIFLPRYIRF